MIPVNTVFDISSQNIDTQQSHLFLITGLNGLSYTILDQNNTFQAVGIFSFDSEISLKTVAHATDEVVGQHSLLKRPYKKKDILYSFTDSVLVPGEIMNESLNKEMLEFVYGDAQEEVVKRDFLYKHNLYNIYRIPSDVYSLMTGTFTSATHTHLHSILPDILKDTQGNHIYCILGTNHITIMLKKNGKLQVIQKFTYRNPEDVAFYLLNVCNGFDVAANETTLHICGMLSPMSTLYTEIYKYFINIRFEDLPNGFQYADEIKSNPPHFFSHLFSIASCV